MMEHLIDEIENIIEAEYSKAERTGSELNSREIALKIVRHLEYRISHNNQKFMDRIAKNCQNFVYADTDSIILFGGENRWLKTK